MSRVVLVVFQQALVLILAKNLLEIQPYHVSGTPITLKLAFIPYNCSSFTEGFPFREGHFPNRPYCPCGPLCYSLL